MFWFDVMVVAVAKFLVLFVITTFAKDICDGVDDCNDKIEELTKKVNELSNKGKSLAGEIAYMDSQVNLTQLRIQNSIAKIAKTTKDIERLETSWILLPSWTSRRIFNPSERC